MQRNRTLLPPQPLATSRRSPLLPLFIIHLNNCVIMNSQADIETLEQQAKLAERDAQQAQQKAAASEAIAVDARRVAETSKTDPDRQKADEASVNAARDKDAAKAAQQAAKEARDEANRAAAEFLNRTREQSIDSRTVKNIGLGGLVFLGIAAFALVVICLWLVKTGVSDKVAFEGSMSWSIILPRIVMAYSGPLLVFIAAVFAAAVGYSLLRRAGTATKQVIPPQDYMLLSQLLISGNKEALGGYIQLSSLTGFVGFFTKVGLTGLPMATIGLTLVFTILAIYVPEPAAGTANVVNVKQGLFDLAKLTLGAFIGSYVTKGTPEIVKAAAGGDVKPAGSGK